MRTIVRRNSIRKHEATSPMTLRVRPGFAIDEMRSFSVNHARKRDRHPVGAASPASRVTPRPARGRGRTNLVRRMREHAAERPGETAFVHLIDGDTPQASMTYAQLDRRARAIAAYLQDMRLAGRNVVLAYPPGLEFIAAFFGALYAGCVAVPAYPPRPTNARSLPRTHRRRRGAPGAQHRRHRRCAWRQ